MPRQRKATISVSVLQNDVFTHPFQKKHNVHMYFDKETGAWVRLPIAWELHNPMVKALVEQIMVSLYDRAKGNRFVKYEHKYRV